MEEEGEGIGAPVTRAEFMLQHLLDRQLSTSARLEQVEFKGATQSFYRGIHGAGGVSTLAEFRSQQDEGGIQKPEEKCKRQRYGPDPVFFQSQEMERKKQALSRESSIAVKQEMGRHEKELEVSLIEGKQRLQDIAHLTVEVFVLIQVFLSENLCLSSASFAVALRRRNEHECNLGKRFRDRHRKCFHLQLHHCWIWTPIWMKPLRTLKVPGTRKRIPPWFLKRISPRTGFLSRSCRNGRMESSETTSKVCLQTFSTSRICARKSQRRI
ncbi:uncharacterized protein LOC9646039 isoform X2 [Selaginella moellendorffii]|uniref:uncharacterized protein LOC9646039 isoform X2 n=1 Tax=Selaginella moellendorffii TaxID=88036 RepID=UPI000D1CD016|nr:uncharacterized protein LOC9646039 isoform X2 [Selaginella moellendorffii]|eukprot:XP_024530366.1 uncharacterized protein LOC9646039 isoform X2 [Selaginella moellendorffii]